MSIRESLSEVLSTDLTNPSDEQTVFIVSHNVVEQNIDASRVKTWLVNTAGPVESANDLDLVEFDIFKTTSTTYILGKVTTYEV